MWRLQTHERFGGTWLSDYVPNRLGGFIGEPTSEPERPDCALIETQEEILSAGQPSPPHEDYLRNAELYEEGQTGNYNMLDGRLNNEPPVKPDLTDGQTHEEIWELAPETLPEEKPSVLDRLKSEHLEHEARRLTPPVQERER